MKELAYLAGLPKVLAGRKSLKVAPMYMSLKVIELTACILVEYTGDI